MRDHNTHTHAKEQTEEAGDRADSRQEPGAKGRQLGRAKELSAKKARPKEAGGADGLEQARTEFNAKGGRDSGLKQSESGKAGSHEQAILVIKCEQALSLPKGSDGATPKTWGQTGPGPA